MIIPEVDLDVLETVFSQLQRQGVRYGYGAKAEGGCDPRNGRRWNPRSNGHLSTPAETIDHIDCSGFVRYILSIATGGDLVLPDGSQPQRQWCERAAAQGAMHQVQHYADTNTYVTSERLFIAFIKPHVNGCGKIGHVWLVGQFDGDAAAETIESCGSQGVGSRPWNTRELRRQVYSVYELPAKRA